MLRSYQPTISKRANPCVSDPTTVVLVNQQVKVSDLEIDIPRNGSVLLMNALPTGTT